MMICVSNSFQLHGMVNKRKDGKNPKSSDTKEDVVGSLLQPSSRAAGGAGDA